MSLALHELTTNAVKHGALSGRDGGRVAIRWKLDGADGARQLNFEWTEGSADGAVPKPGREGFGMELLTRLLPYDLGARTSVEFRDGGLRFEMDLPGEHLASIAHGEE
jgi:two-component sensor histidine kinase